MASAVQQRRESMRADEGFLPVRLDSLRVDTVTEFDLYIQSKDRDQPVLYRKRDLTFTEDARKRLLEHEIHELLVPLTQQEAYDRYLEAHLPGLLTDPRIAVEDRTQILYNATKNAVKEMLLEPRAQNLLPRSDRLVQHVTDFMFSEKEAFSHFLQTTSFDYLTYTHSVNVFVYTVTLARRAGMTDMAFLLELGTGALLHDIGKSKIDPAILHFRGALTDEQWGIMKQHPQWGHDILREHGVTSDIILNVTLYHHEKLLGSGYPNGLKGKDIPDYVRVCTICDIFDALTTQRSYKGALNSFPALRLMQDEMRKDIDQEYFRVFIDMLHNPVQAA